MWIGRDGQLNTSIYDKGDDFNFHITNVPFLRMNIPSSPAYGVFISQLILYARACSSYEYFILRTRRYSSKLLKREYLVERLTSSFMNFYGRYGDLIQQCEVSLSDTNVKLSFWLVTWPVTVTSKPIRLFTNVHDLHTGLDFCRITTLSKWNGCG